MDDFDSPGEIITIEMEDEVSSIKTLFQTVMKSLADGKVPTKESIGYLDHRLFNQAFIKVMMDSDENSPKMIEYKSGIEEFRFWIRDANINHPYFLFHYIWCIIKDEKTFDNFSFFTWGKIAGASLILKELGVIQCQ